MSKNSIIEKIEQEQLKTNVPSFSPGDTIVVQVRIKEGERERLQAFEGVVIGKRNRGLNSAFTVRKMSHGVGVERTFQTHSNLIESITVKRRGDVRQAKLYYLRDLTGRAARIAEKLGKKGEQDTETPLDDSTSIAEQIEAAQEEDLASGALDETVAEEAVAEDSSADEAAEAPVEEAPAEEIAEEQAEEPVAEAAEEEQAAAEPASEAEAPAEDQQDQEEEKKD